MRATDRLDRLTRLGVGLHLSDEASAMRTPFRDSVLNYIYRIVLDLSDGCLEEASVSVWSNPGEEDSVGETCKSPRPETGRGNHARYRQ